MFLSSALRALAARVAPLLAAAALTPLAGAQVIHIWPAPPQPAPPPPVVVPLPRPVPPIHRGLEVRSHQVHVTLTDQLATTRIEQVIYNPSHARVEGTLLLPLPPGAHIDRFSMDVDGEDTEAELLDADKARRIYEDIVRQSRDPAFLEYMDRGLLRARIFPFEPQREKRVTLTYTQALESDGGLVHYAYPVVGRTLDGAPMHRLAMKVELRTARPITTVYSPSHAVEVRRDGDRRATLGFEIGGPDAAPDADFQLYFGTAPAPDKAEAGGVAFDVVTFRDPLRTPGDDAGYFLLLATPGPQAADRPALPKDIVFVLDTSGSMSHDKLDQARRALRFCLDNLGEGDRFEVVRFSTDVEPLFGEVRPADDEALARADAFIDRLKPIGGTAIHDALRQAQATLAGEDDRPDYIVFLTDGRPTIGETDVDRILRLVEDAGGDDRVFAFGIGTDVNTHLLDRLAEKGRAATEYVLPDEDIELKVSRFYTKIAQPVLTDLAIDAGDGVRLTRMYPFDLPDLFRGEQLMVFGRYEGEGDAELTLTGRVAGEARSFAKAVEFPELAREHESLPRLWATRRVGYLLDEIRLRGDDPELRDEVTRLARDFGIVTPYTAYLILEDEMRRNIPADRLSLGVDGDASRAREYFRYEFESMGRADSGNRGVAGAMSNQALKEAAAGPQLAQAEANEWAEGRKLELTGPASPVAAAAPAQPVSSLQPARHVKGRTFVQQGAKWIDTRAQAMPPTAEPQRIAFNSDAYFQLIADHPEAAAWLSVARNVQLVIAGRLYEITDES